MHMTLAGTPCSPRLAILFISNEKIAIYYRYISYCLLFGVVYICACLTIVLRSLIMKVFMMYNNTSTQHCTILETLVNYIIFW